MFRRAIVGVIGGNKVEKPTTCAAKLCGSAVRSLGAILLTGSQPIAGPQVKRAAMRGAIKDGREAHLVGILPDSEKRPIVPVPNTWKLIETGLSSPKRNPLNAMTADALLVFKGNTGTLAELAFAVAAKKPIIFVDSTLALRECADHAGTKLTNDIGEGLAAFPTIGGEAFEVSFLRDQLFQCLAAAKDVALESSLDQPTATSLVERAIGQIPQQALAQPSGFPGLPGKLSKDEFEHWLHQVVGSTQSKP